MKNRKNLIAGVVVALIVIGGTSYFLWPKGENPNRAARLAVKSTTDPAARQIAMNDIRETTIEDILGNEVPASYGQRVGPFETTVWRVKAKVETIELKKDGDYYMVVSGEKGGRTAVEVPDPEKCKGSPMYDQIAATRKQLKEKFHPTLEKKEVNETATITGVGFLGFGSKPKAGATGITGPRLMPGLSIGFGP